MTDALPVENPEPNPEVDAPASATPSLPVPWLTYAIIALCGAIFGYFNLAQRTSSYETVTWFLVPSPYQIWKGAYWAFISAAFVHVGFIHILFNMWWAKDFGKLMEPTMGRPRYLLFILAAAAVGSGAQLAISDQTGVGYSGVLYALFGYTLASRHVVPLYQRLLTKQTIQMLLGWLVLCIVLTATKVWNIANGAHIAGFIFGYCIGQAFVVRTHVTASLMGVALLAGLTVLSAVYMPWSSLWPYRETAWKIYDARRLALAGDAEGEFYYGVALLQTKGEKAEALSWLKKSAEQGNIQAMNALAWQLAVDSDATVRNGSESLRWAELACEKDGWKNPAYVDTLAAAQAELNRWDDAAATEKQAIAKVLADDSELRASCNSRLEKYLKHEKTRE